MSTETLLAAAVSAAERRGFNRMTFQDVADAAGCSKQLPVKHFGTMPQLRRKVMRHAVAVGNLRLIAQGIVLRDSHAVRAPEALRRAALESAL